MKRRLVSLLLVLCLTLSLLPVLPVGAASYRGTCGNSLYWALDTVSGILTISGTGNMWNMADTEATDYSTKAPWKPYRESIKSIVILDGCTSIGELAFQNCRNLTDVKISNTVISIDQAAFYGCQNLQKIVIPDNVKQIAIGAFLYCSSLKEVKLPKDLPVINNIVFERTALTDISIPDTVTSINVGAFRECKELKDIILPPNVSAIGESAFEGCKLKSITIWNPECTIFDNNHTISLDIRATFQGVIRGYAGSTAENYAKKYHYRFEVIDGSYYDVPESKWYYSAVQFVSAHNLMNGVDVGKFAPEQAMTRGMLVTVLWRYADSPKQGENTFTDVPAGKYYTEAVAWAAANGIVNGVGDGKFNPDGNITREQLVTILYRYCKQLGINTSKADNLTGFPDAGTVGNSAKEAMRWAVAEKLIGGKTLDASGTVYLQPKGSATRAEVATILMRFIENILE